MEISKLVDSIILRLHEGGVYSEMSDDSLKDILCHYLANEYNRRLSDLSIKFDLRIISGEKLNQSDYDTEFAHLKETITDLMNDIARVK